MNRLSPKYSVIMGSISLLVLAVGLLIYMYLVLSARLMFPVWIFVGLEFLGLVALGLLAKLFFEQSRNRSGKGGAGRL